MSIKQLPPIHPFLQPPAATSLLSVSVDLPGLDISCKWSHRIRDHLCLASLTDYDVLQVRPCHIACVRTSFLFMIE